MAGRLIWWQLSDIHWPSQPTREHLDFAHHLVEELGGSVLHRHGTPTFVAITGDIAKTGSSSEYVSVADSIFKPLKQMLSSHGNVPIVSVPGNHDLNRRDADSLSADKIAALASPAEVDEFLANDRQIQLYTYPFAYYSEFASTHLAPDASDPLAWNKCLEVGDTRLSLTGINSAWSSYYWSRAASESDERRLLIGRQQLLDLATEGSSDVRILLAHHPLDWMNREICSRVEQRIRQSYDVFLFGHVHSPRDLSLSIVPKGRCCLVPSPLLYRNEYEDSVEFARGFAVCEVDLETTTLRAFYYRYSDAFGPKFVPYTDLYESGRDCFTARLRHPAGQSLRAPLVDGSGRSDSATIDPHSRQMTRLRQAVRGYEELIAPRLHSIEMYRQLLSAIDFSGTPFLSPVASDACALAFILCELAIAHTDNGLIDRTGISGQLLHNLRELSDACPSVTHADRVALSELVDRVSLVNHNALTSYRGDMGDYASLAFSIAWGVAQIALLFDSPWFIPDYLSGSRVVPVDASGPNIMSVVKDPSADNLKLNVRTSTRVEFHGIVEARHLIEQYFLHVEDMWRRLSLIPPVVRFDLHLPRWRHRSLESHVMQVDSMPITRLLMGKALYGSRQHVWLRELVQNAMDATESRRVAVTDESYIPKIRVVWNDSHLVTISDNGNGMSHQHVLNYLATLGRSGWRTADFQGSDFDEKSFFGRFGIGFASVFSVASRVTVTTRRAGSRAVDGLRVSFSGPDRPFFLEPAPCPEGTEIRIELKDALSVTSFHSALTELFIYLPQSVHVEPSANMPVTLEDYSLLSSYPKAPPLEASVCQTSDVTLGAFVARIKTELFMPKDAGKRRRRGDYSLSDGLDVFGSSVPTTALDVAIDGIRLFRQKHLRLHKSGRPPEENSYGRELPNLGFRGLYVTVDFRREDAPVLPSRDALDIDDDFVSEFHTLMETQFNRLLPRLVESAGDGLDPGQARGTMLRCFAAVVKNESPGYRDTVPTYHQSKAVSESAAKVFLDQCALSLMGSDGKQKLISLENVAPLTCSVAVASSIAKGRAFGIYADSRKIDSWLLLDHDVEARLLNEAWPFDESLKVITSIEELTRYIDDLATEVCSGEIVKLLRGDYALVRSQLFAGELYMQVPSRVGRTPRYVSARSRIEVTPMRPRVVINADHPLIARIEEYLRSCGENGRHLIRAWLRSFCDGVVEDVTVQAPMARWEQLYLELRETVGDDLPSVIFDSLRVRL